MNKADSAMLGGAIVTLLIFAYGLKTGRGWKYWVLSLLFMPYAGGAIGYALGTEDPNLQNQNNQLTSFYLAQKEKELCRERECKDRGGMYVNGKCQATTTTDKHLIFPTIELTGCK
jgi:hypothetical protein